jgi:hypothetical protein
MAIDETVRKYQTKGSPVTKKLDKKEGPHKVTHPPTSVSVQFDDVKKRELSHNEVPGYKS